MNFNLNLNFDILKKQCSPTYMNTMHNNKKKYFSKLIYFSNLYNNGLMLVLLQNL